jgi:hypothetical protein
VLSRVQVLTTPDAASQITRIPLRSATLPGSREVSTVSEEGLLQDLVDLVWIMCTFRLFWQEPFQRGQASSSQEVRASRRAAVARELTKRK